MSEPVEENWFDLAILVLSDIASTYYEFWIFILFFFFLFAFIFFWWGKKKSLKEQQHGGTPGIDQTGPSDSELTAFFWEKKRKRREKKN